MILFIVIKNEEFIRLSNKVSIFFCTLIKHFIRFRTRYININTILFESGVSTNYIL
uniref:Uncharacterized protein n=1 Tax=Lepeophtheirus salmonis TaxID=72036 RepID=A0A0K2T0U6_LEPSM